MNDEGCYHRRTMRILAVDMGTGTQDILSAPIKVPDVKYAGVLSLGVRYGE